MNIRALHVFKTVCEELSFTKTAAKLNMTQPAVSHVIRELEQDIGMPLFDRVSRKIYLNEAGKYFFNKAVRILELYDDLANNFSISEDKLPIHIGSGITIANFWLPQAVKAFKKLHPETPLDIKVEPAALTEKRLLKNEIDIALIEGAVSDNSLIKKAFSSYEVVVAGSLSLSLARGKEITVSELLEQDLLLREKGSAVRDSFDSALLLHQVKAEPAWTSVNSQALIRAAKSGLGFAVVAENLIQRELDDGDIVKLNIQGLRIVNENYVVYHKEKYLTQTMQDFINIIMKTEKESS